MSNRGNRLLFLRIGLAIAADFVLNTALVMISYSIWEEFTWGRYPRSYWIEVCIVAGLVSTVIVVAGTVLSQWVTRSQSEKNRAKWQISSVFVLLSSWAILVGTSSPTSGISLPEVVQVMHTKLFSEAQFFRFIFYDAIPMAVISQVLITAVLRGRKS
jgi:hypothetical protein